MQKSLSELEHAKAIYKNLKFREGVFVCLVTKSKIAYNSQLEQKLKFIIWYFGLSVKKTYYFKLI